ncbi:MAG: lipid-A-disaccharide synthase [bacterium]
MHYYLIAGEASGDLHASNLMKALKNHDPSAIFRCWGGDLMEKAGGTLVKHYRDLAYMGFLEVITHLGKIIGNLRFCEKELLSYKPDVLILVDYPGFNLRIAKFASRNGIRVFYYISPQLWAWKSSRVRTIRKSVERMFVILPFEKKFYAGHGLEVDFVGHPLLDVIETGAAEPDRDSFFRDNSLDNRPVIALLPGSRMMEVGNMLKVMSSVVSRFGDHQFVVAGAPAIPKEFYNSILNDLPVRVLFNQTYDLLLHSAAAIVTSGTATLETALLRVPQIVCYKGNPLSYAIARWIVHVPFISLVNLIYEKLLVREFIQEELTTENLVAELNKILDNDDYRQMMRAGYIRIVESLGGKGASERCAKLMIQYLHKI